MFLKIISNPTDGLGTSTVKQSDKVSSVRKSGKVSDAPESGMASNMVELSTLFFGAVPSQLLQMLVSGK